MSRQSNIKTKTYQEYLDTLNKNVLIQILDNYHINYKKGQKKQIYQKLVLENVNNIVKKTISFFQIDEYYNLKYLIKKKGKVTVKFNRLLLIFLQNLARNNLVIEVNDNTYYMPNELFSAYKKELKSKLTSKTIQKNTEEYNLIQGFIDAYGVIDFDIFYSEYSKKYKLLKPETLERINDLSKFYLEFNIFNDNKQSYLASNSIKSLKECKEYLKMPGDYAIYTNTELIEIHTFKYMEKFKSYRKFKRFINRNYEVSKSSFKIINKYILIPFMTNKQQNIDNSKDILSTLIDQYFEFNNQKAKDKLISLIENVALDYPKWNLKGKSERI